MQNKRNTKYRHVTVFARQNENDRIKRKGWRTLGRHIGNMMRTLPIKQREQFFWLKHFAVEKYQMRFSHHKHYYCEPETIEAQAIGYAVAFRFFCLPWTLAISAEEAERALVDLDFLSRYILDNYQIKLKILP